MKPLMALRKKKRNNKRKSGTVRRNENVRRTKMFSLISLNKSAVGQIETKQRASPLMQTSSYSKLLRRTSCTFGKANLSKTNQRKLAQQLRETWRCRTDN